MKKQLTGLAIVLMALLSWSGLAVAHDGHDHGTEATPESSPMVDTGTGAAYFTLRNTGDTEDVLIGASTPASQWVEIHTMEMADGVMTMMELEDGLLIPAGESVALAPGGYHLMLINLNHDLTADSTFELTLQFAQGGDVTVTVAVQQNAPESEEVLATAGTIEVISAWSRPAPMLDDCGCHADFGTPVASPESH